MSNGKRTIRILESANSEREELVLELQRLLSCYQMATADDKKVVWAVLNKYAPLYRKYINPLFYIQI